MSLALQFAIGAGTGYNFSRATEKGDEAQKGKNHYLISLNGASQMQGHFNFSRYICAVMGENTALSEIEKMNVIEKRTERNDGLWSSESAQMRFNRLACVMLGIVTFDSIVTDWTEIDTSQLPLPPRTPDETWEVL